MTGEAPSLTAQRVAMRRAAFEDPLAIAIIGQEAPARLMERGGPRHLRAFLAARSRCAEDELTAAIGRGARQYVVLGAGLDTYAYRNPHARVRIFEVDHPATQAWKRTRLEAAGIAIPSSVTFVPTDFEALAAVSAV